MDILGMMVEWLWLSIVVIFVFGILVCSIFIIMWCLFSVRLVKGCFIIIYFMFGFSGLIWCLFRGVWYFWIVEVRYFNFVGCVSLDVILVGVRVLLFCSCVWVGWFWIFWWVFGNWGICVVWCLGWYRVDGVFFEKVSLDWCCDKVNVVIVCWCF